jgi:peroxiredoxin Q/BCP
MPTATLLPVIGKPAPDFSLPSTSGESVTLKQFKGKKTVVLYFYPEDETPGCTKEACGFRDLTAQFEAAGAVILGVSANDMETHLRFRTKHKLPFELLVDADATISKQYGVWKQKNLYGKKFMGIERTTFVIDKTGRIAQIYPKVKVEGRRRGAGVPHRGLTRSGARAAARRHGPRRRAPPHGPGSQTTRPGVPAPGSGAVPRGRDEAARVRAALSHHGARRALGRAADRAGDAVAGLGARL